MSYILDALVKADYARQCELSRGSVPGLHTVHAQLPPKAPVRRFKGGPYLAGAGVAGLLVVAGWQLGSAPPTSGPVPQAVVVPAAAAAVPRPSAPAFAPALSPAPLAAPAAVRSPELPAPHVAARSAPTIAPSGAGRVAERPAKAVRTASAADVSSDSPGEAAPSHRVLAAAELPPALQREVQKIQVSGYANADDPQAKMAIINDRAMREGDFLAGGVRIEAIASDGVVFSHKGYRFRIGGP